MASMLTEIASIRSILISDLLIPTPLIILYNSAHLYKHHIYQSIVTRYLPQAKHRKTNKRQALALGMSP